MFTSFQTNFHQKPTRAVSDAAVKNSNLLFDSQLHLTGILLVDSDRHGPIMTGTNADLPDMMSGTGQIFISGAAKPIVLRGFNNLDGRFSCLAKEGL